MPSDVRHVVTEPDLRTFISLMPEWAPLSVCLRGLVPGDGDGDCYGWHDVGVTCIHAWSRELVELWSADAFEQHKSVLDRLMVRCERVKTALRWCAISTGRARANS